ncbi:YlbF family regulator [Halalkalibacter hemicellulosilyticus]|uniref:ComK regulator n=1 Tax=Halalkalibacter hemicellulosilyticusJCM 9152 TaxID=1236971 RepID=W4QAT1_9BACI|nr:YlbF family regulator [Halalkalibacter hemicellulosilyticus]GAE29125.1 ComK regulator [Halalkalibacter hemicellulosilyticusJCM 9152]
MLATMSTIELLDGADELAKAVIESDVYHEYIEAKQKLEKDVEAQKRISAFNHMKDQYEDVQRFGKYHPDYDEISANIRKAKRAVDLTDTVVEFKKAERELESLLNEISGIIAHSVSKTIKVPTGNPFFDSMSCSGGCASGSCGCSS